jgi:hypothetical protein
MSSHLKRSLVLGFAATLVVFTLVAPASAKQPPVTKMTFKLVSHQLLVGDAVDVTVHVLARSGHAWVGVAGATVVITVDGLEVGTGITDDTGTAVVAWVASAEGDHVMKVLFAGDELHKRAQRAQGFTVSAAVPVVP